MSDERGRAGRTFTHAELDEHVASLHAVGGLYEFVAMEVEHGERPLCTGEPTNVQPPWHRA